MAEDALALARCRFDGWDAVGAPEVWALQHPGDSSAAPEAERSRMRHAARDALRERLATVFGVPVAAIAISSQRGAAPRVHGQPSADAALAASLSDTGLSISHEAGVSLVAWHADGPVGVDVVRLDAQADTNELARVAKLYLGPNKPPTLVDQAPAAIDSRAFLQRWACHEARLKCVGLGLLEWSDALAAALAGIHATSIALPPWVSGAVAAIAWRAPGDGHR